MAKKKKTRTQQQTTLIIVGEGEHEKAFLQHMKSIYDSRFSGKKVTLDFAGGGSPRDIISYTDKHTRHTAFDFIYILMDSDIDISSKDLKIAKDKSFIILQSEPLCLEGMLLEVLKQPALATAQACKDKLHPQLSGNPAIAESYSPLFDKPVLDKTSKATIVTLREVLAKTY